MVENGPKDTANRSQSDESSGFVSRPPRRFAVVDIKLLRLGLIAKDNGPCQGISTEWIPAQPSENLSPFLAAEHLKLGKNETLGPWMRGSVASQKYRSLQLRFPPDQFSAMHLNWRPAAELLSSPLARLNWYWQSGLIPGPEITESLGQEEKNKVNDLVCGNFRSLSAALKALR